MDHVDLILKLKDLLRDTCGKQAISRLIQLPLIVDYLNDPNNFQLVVEKLGKDCQSWNPTNVCRVACGLDLKSPSTNSPQIQDYPGIEEFRESINPNLIEKIDSVIEIYPLAERINAVSKGLPWYQLLDQIGIGRYSFSEPKKILETIFENVFEITDSKDDFIDCLIDNQVGVAGKKLLSKLIVNNTSTNVFVIHALETKSIKPSVDEFVALLKELQIHGEQEIYKKLTEVYLKVFPFDEKSLITKSEHGLEDSLQKLQYLKNYHELFQLIRNIENLEIISQAAKDVLSNLGQELGFSTQFIKDDKEIHNAIGINNSGKEITREFNRIIDIAKTDIDSANALAIEFSQKLLDDPTFASSYNEEDSGFMISPETLAQFLVDFGLFSQAKAILNKFIAQWPHNAKLLRIAANLAHDKGDHYYSADKFALLDVNAEMTREEKIKFATSLEYMDSWKNAFEIRKGINISTEEDIRDLLVCMFHAGTITALPSLISENEKLIRSSKIAMLLQMVAEDAKEQIISKVGNLEATDYSNDKHQNYFLLISDYLRKFGESDLAETILENCVKYSKFNLPIINRLHSIYLEKGDREKSSSIINSIKDQTFEAQKDLESFINILIQSGEIERADQLLIRSVNSWELSPRKINFKGKILIEKGKFSEAEKVLYPLIQNDKNDFEYQLDYCLAVLRCKFENFPFGIDIKNQKKFEKLRKIIFFDEEKKSLLSELLDIELSISDHFEKYQKLLNKYSSNSDPDIWRIHAGLGKLFFDLNQFDSAIINLKRANQIHPNNQVIYWMLIQSYASLRLWNEIESMLNQSMIQDSHSILSNFGQFGILSDNSEWPRFLETQIQKKPDEIVYKVLMAHYFARKDMRKEAVDLIKSFYEKLGVDNELYLLCVQILVDANEAQLAERLVEIFLVNKKSPDKSDYLSCAFLFEHLGRSEKALAMMNHIRDLDFVLLTFKSKLLNDLGKKEQFEKLLSEVIEKDDQFVVSFDDLNVKIPDFVKLIQENPSRIYLMESTSQIKNRDTDKGISILELGLKMNPDDLDIQFNLLDLLSITGKNERLEVMWEKCSRSAPENQSSHLLCLLGEIALSHGEEVKSANFLSEAMKLTPEEPRIKALQARILAINGNTQEANSILNEIVLTKKNTTPENDCFTAESCSVGSRFWLAKASRDLKDNKKALEICQQEILRFGYHSPLIDLFLSALSAELENKFVLNELKGNDYLRTEIDEWQKIFTNIIETQSISHSNIDIDEKLINKCRLFLEDDENVLAAAEKLDPNPENINSKIFAIFKLKGLEAAEIAFNTFVTNENNEFFLAVLEKDLNQVKSLGHLQKAIRLSAPEANHNALLALIEKNIGNFSDAYAAISLALEHNPDVYEWQILAGDLCKMNGDLHKSISHYQKAQSINLSQSIDNKIENLYLALGTPEAIPILEKQLLKNPNLAQIIQLGKIYIKFGNYRKAINVFESATKEYPENAENYFWLSVISLNLNNPGKGLKSIEHAIERDGWNNQYICKKAEIIEKIEGFSQAKKYIDDELIKKGNKDIGLFKYKVRLISNHDGENAALKMLNSDPSLSEIPELMFEKAVLELQMGKIGDSELIAEKLLQIKEMKVEVLALLGSISKTKGEFDRAIDFYVKSIEADPFSVGKFLQLAEIYNDRKEFKSAMRTLEDGLRSNPGSFDLLYRAGLCFYQQGGYNEAGKYLREAIRIKPDHREIKELLGLLDNVLAIREYSLVGQSA